MFPSHDRGGDVVVSGSFRSRQLHYTTHKYNATNSFSNYVRFDRNGIDASPGPDNKMIAPYSGRLIKVLIRAESDPGSTDIKFHKNTDGNAQLDATATETSTVAGGAANTSYSAQFNSSIFNAGDIIGLEVDPTNQPDETVITAVWEFDNYLD